MKLVSYSFVLLAGGLASASAHRPAVTPPVHQPGTPPSSPPAAKAGGGTSREAAGQMAEDVEIMRRILNKTLNLPGWDQATRYYAGGQNSLNGFSLGHYHNPGLGITTSGGEFVPGSVSPYLNTHVNPAALLFDGVYLAGHGVVYTARVPSAAAVAVDPPNKGIGLASTCSSCHANVDAAKLQPPPAAAKPASDWDRVQGELRGVKADDKKADQPARVKTADICKPGTVAEVLIEALARNGKNFRHLPKTENITVVITFDGISGPAAPTGFELRSHYEPQIDPKTGKMNSVVKQYYAPIGSPPPSPTSNPADLLPPATPNATGAFPSPPPPGRLPGFNAEETRQVSLGDLHVRNNNPAAAVEAYQKALGRVAKGTVTLSFPKDYPAAAAVDEIKGAKKSVEDVLKKLAQALIAVGKIEEAKNTLDLTANVKVQSTAELVAERKQPGGATPIPVPAKLVVTVSRDKLDALADDPAAFRKAVKVETVGFPPADKVPGEKKE